MPIRKAKPTSPGRRFQSHSDFSDITRAEPEKSLLEPKPKKGGRNSYGRITTRHQGGGNKVRYRQIDFRREKDGIPAKVAHVEYDPNRNARIALLHYKDGEKRYILMPNRVKVGDVIQSGPGADIRPGNALPFANIPTGTLVHNVELKPGRGGQLVRSAGVVGVDRTEPQQAPWVARDVRGDVVVRHCPARERRAEPEHDDAVEVARVLVVLVERPPEAQVAAPRGARLGCESLADVLRVFAEVRVQVDDHRRLGYRRGEERGVLGRSLPRAVHALRRRGRGRR